MWDETVCGEGGNFYAIQADTKLKLKAKGWVRWDVGKFMSELSTSTYQCEGKNS